MYSAHILECRYIGKTWERLSLALSFPWTRLVIKPNKTASFCAWFCCLGTNMDVIHQMETYTSLVSPGYCKPFFVCVNNFQNF